MNTSRHARDLLPIFAITLMMLAGCGSKSAEDKSTEDKSTQKTGTAQKTTANGNSNATTGTVKNTPDNGLDTSYLLPDFYLGAVVYPGRVLKSPALNNPFLGELFEDAKKNAGFDPRDIESVLVAADPAQQRFAAVIRFSKPIDSELVVSKMLKEGHEKATHNGAEYYRNSAMTNPSAHFPNDKTVVLGLEADLQRMMGKPAASSELITRLKGLDLSHDFAGTFVMSGLPEQIRSQMKRNPIPQPFTPLGEVPDLVTAVTIGAKLVDSLELNVILSTKSERDGSRLQQIVGPSVDLGKGLAAQQLGQLPPQASQVVKPILDSITSQVQGSDVHISLKAEAAGATGMLTALLLPAVQQARAAARFTVQRNRFKQIGVALHNYHDSHQQFPVASDAIKRDANGKPLLSWRVHILPFLEEGVLYRQFKLDEPWDSAHNMKLIKEMPEVYFTEHNREAGKTTVQAPVTEDSVFGGIRPVRIRDMTDGLSNTIIVVNTKAEHAVQWTKPADLSVNAESPVSGLEAGIRGFLVLFGDGSTRAISPDLEANMYMNLFNKSDGNAIGDIDPAFPGRPSRGRQPQ